MKKCVILLMAAILLSGCAAEKHAGNATEEPTAETETVVAEEKLPDGMERYEAKGGFSVVYPVEWNVQTGYKVGGIDGCEFYAEEPESKSNVSIAVYPFDASMNELTRAMIEQQYADLDIEVEVHEFFRGIRNSLKTIETEYTIWGNSVTQISFIDNDVYYSLVYTKKEGMTEENDAVMQELINSVKKNN